MAKIREQYGVPARRGGRIALHTPVGDCYGTITGSSRTGLYLRIRLDELRRVGNYHPTWNLTYLPATPPVTPKG